MNVLKKPLELTILGISASGPCKARHPSALYGKTYQQNFLLDVGQGAQKRIMEEDLSLMVDFIFVSHRHTDHYAGLGPLLQTMYRMQRTALLNIYVPDIDFFKNYLSALKVNTSFINLIPILPGVQYIQKDLYLEFFKRIHGLGDVTTYGIKITSTSEQTYDKSKLKEFESDQISTLFKTKKLELNGKTFVLEDFLESNKNLINFYYTSDGLFDKDLYTNLQKEPPGSLFVTECTHYHVEDILNSHKTEHTHFSKLMDVMDEKYENPCTILVHLGEKITEKVIFNLNKKNKLDEKNIYFGNENMVIRHNYRTAQNQVCPKKKI